MDRNPATSYRASVARLQPARQLNRGGEVPAVAAGVGAVRAMVQDCS